MWKARAKWMKPLIWFSRDMSPGDSGTSATAMLNTCTHGFAAEEITRSKNCAPWKWTGRSPS